MELPIPCVVDDLVLLILLIARFDHTLLLLYLAYKMLGIVHARLAPYQPTHIPALLCFLRQDVLVLCFLGFCLFGWLFLRQGFCVVLGILELVMNSQRYPCLCFLGVDFPVVSYHTHK